VSDVCYPATVKARRPLTDDERERAERQVPCCRQAKIRALGCNQDVCEDEIALSSLQIDFALMGGR